MIGLVNGIFLTINVPTIVEKVATKVVKEQDNLPYESSFCLLKRLLAFMSY